MRFWNVSVVSPELVELDLTPEETVNPGLPSPGWLAANLERLGIEATLDRVDMRAARCRYVSSYPDEDWPDRWPWTWTVRAFGEVRRAPSHPPLVWAHQAAFFESVEFSQIVDFDRERPPDSDEVLILGAARLRDEQAAEAIERVRLAVEDLGVTVVDRVVRRFEPAAPPEPAGMADFLARLGPSAQAAREARPAKAEPLHLLRIRLSALRFPEGQRLAEKAESAVEEAGFLTRHQRVTHALRP